LGFKERCDDVGHSMTELYASGFKVTAEVGVN
jgi:hypothetical protein